MNLKTRITATIYEFCALFGVVLSWDFVNGLLQFLILIVSLISALIGLREMRKK